MDVLGDFIPYNLEGLLGLRAHFNGIVWPAQPVVTLMLLAIMLYRHSGQILWRKAQPWFVAACWLACGLVYQNQFASMLDWTAPYSAWLLVFEGILIGAAGLFFGETDSATEPGFPGGQILMLWALVVAPLSQWLTGTPLQSIALAGLDPGITALFTAGWLLGRKGCWWLWPLPLSWMLMELAMGIGLGYIPAMLSLPVTIVVAIMHSRARDRAEGSSG